MVGTRKPVRWATAALLATIALTGCTPHGSGANDPVQVDAQDHSLDITAPPTVTSPLGKASVKPTVAPPTGGVVDNKKTVMLPTADTVDVVANEKLTLTMVAPKTENRQVVLTYADASGRDANVQLGTVKTNAQGMQSATVVIPGQLGAGKYLLAVRTLDNQIYSVMVTLS